MSAGTGSVNLGAWRPCRFPAILIVTMFMMACVSATAQIVRSADPVQRSVTSVPVPPSSQDRAQMARDDLREAARAWVADQTRGNTDTIDIGALDARVDPSTCDAGYSFDFPFQTRTTVRARCINPPRQLFLRVAIASLEPRLAVNRELQAGHVLRSQDLSTRMARHGTTGISDPSQAIGRALVRTIAAGELLDARDLDELVTIARTVVPLRDGDRINTSVLRFEEIPRRSAPPGALTTLDGQSLSLRRAVPAGHLLIQDDLVDARTVLVARRPMMRGDRLDESAFELVEKDRRQVPPDHLLSAEGLDHAELIAPLRAGDILRASQVRRSTVVRKGQLVLLTIARSGIEISVRVEAMEDARMGEQLKLRNPDSGKTLAGVATGQGTARAL